MARRYGKGIEDALFVPFDDVSISVVVARRAKANAGRQRAGPQGRCEVAGFGKFAGGGTMAEYVSEIWRFERCPVPRCLISEASQMNKDQREDSGGDRVSLADEPAVKEVLVNSILGLWDVVNNLARLRPSRSDRYRVTIFGSARVPNDHWVYVAIRDLSAELTRLGCDIVTGGGPGLMQAANEGVRQADPKGTGESHGIRVELPFEQEVNAFVTQAYEHRTFFTRLHHFVLVSDAYVVVPGGIGTMLETMMVWQLLQVRSLRNTPFILVGEMYSAMVDWCRKHMLRADCPLASAEDMDISVCFNYCTSIVNIIL